MFHRALLTQCGVGTGRQYYVLSLPRPSPLRDHDEAAAQTPAPTAPRSAGGQFEAPPGFVLRGRAVGHAHICATVPWLLPQTLKQGGAEEPYLWY